MKDGTHSRIFAKFHSHLFDVKSYFFKPELPGNLPGLNSVMNWEEASISPLLDIFDEEDGKQCLLFDRHCCGTFNTCVLSVGDVDDIW